MPAAPPILGSTGSTTLVLAILLVALGIGMIMTTVWLVRATRTDTRVLGPLEVLGDRRFARRDDAARAAALTAARPPGFQPPAPMVDPDPDAPSPTAAAATVAAAVPAIGESGEQVPASTVHSSAPVGDDDDGDGGGNGESGEQVPASTAHSSVAADSRGGNGESGEQVPASTAHSSAAADDGAAGRSADGADGADGADATDGVERLEPAPEST